MGSTRGGSLSGGEQTIPVAPSRKHDYEWFKSMLGTRDEEVRNRVEDQYDLNPAAAAAGTEHTETGQGIGKTGSKNKGVNATRMAGEAIKNQHKVTTQDEMNIFRSLGGNDPSGRSSLYPVLAAMAEKVKKTGQPYSRKDATYTLATKGNEDRFVQKYLSKNN